MDTDTKQGSPRVDSPNLKQLALATGRKQWTTDPVYIWGNKHKGAYLRRTSLDGATVKLYITDSGHGCVIFVLYHFTRGWEINPNLDRDYREWVRKIHRIDSEPVPASPVGGLAARRLAEHARWKRGRK